MKIKWLNEPEDHDYPAAVSYLSLIYKDYEVTRIVERLKQEKNIKLFKAKDIFRASELPLLKHDNSHVNKNIEKIKNGKELSPILLVRDKFGVKCIIADGYHRVCAVYCYDEDALIPCKIV